LYFSTAFGGVSMDNLVAKVLPDNRLSYVNSQIKVIITDEKLDDANNVFFLNSRNCKNISLNSAVHIAYNWREITKTFLFTCIKGLNSLVDSITQKQNINDDSLQVLQTAVAIICDDLNNACSIFKKVAPKGPAGIHYRWWEDTILLPLMKLETEKPKLSYSTQQLLNKMQELSNIPMGVAVQLRVVEAIAIHIAKAFLQVFEKVIHNNELIFKSNDEMLWITTHIAAEALHDQQVCDEVSGMVKIVQTKEDEQQMFTVTQDYCAAWSAALNDFARFL
jgi:hypothetical protein